MASRRVLSFAFLAVVAAFIGSTIWSQRENQRASDAALAISKVAAPEIEALATTRARLRVLESRVLRQQFSGEDESQVARAREEVNESLRRDVPLVTSPAEHEAMRALEAAVLAVNVSTTRAVEQARLGARTEAARTVRVELRRLADEADAAAAALVELETRKARVAAETVAEAIARSNRIAFLLDAVSAALAVFAALLALRAVRAAERAQEQQRALVERKAAELEMFAGRVAHDILSPLNTVSMALAVARRDPAAPQAASALSRGEASLGRVGRIVDGLLEFARAGAQPEPGAVTQVAPLVAGLKDELAALAAQEKGQLRVEPFAPCAVQCSQGVLLSLLSNLLRNAFKYLGDAQRRTVTLRVAPRRTTVRFEIEDTGPGIPPESADRLFQPFVRGPGTGTGTGKPGIGLGLATVKRLVDAHGGAVSVQPAPGGGALFAFELPATEPVEAFVPLPARPVSGA